MIETSGKVKRQNSIHLNIITMHIEYVHGSKANTGLEYVQMKQIYRWWDYRGMSFVFAKYSFKISLLFFCLYNKKEKHNKRNIRSGSEWYQTKEKKGGWLILNYILKTYISVLISVFACQPFLINNVLKTESFVAHR